MIGILAAYYQQWWAVPCALSIPSLITIAHSNTVSKKSFVYALFFMIGFLRTDTFLNYRAALFPLWHTSVEATVETITFVQSKTWRYQVLLKVDRYFDTGTWKEKPFVLQLYTHQKPTFKVADKVHCALDHINKPEGEFKTYLFKEGIDATAFQPVVISKIINRPIYSFKRWIAHKKRIIHYHLLKKINKPTFTLFSSLFLGNRSSVKEDLESQKPLFKLWGIAHFLARSGFHLLIFIGIWSALMQYVALPFILKQLFLLFLTCIYFLFSWSSISFYRAFYTIIFVKLTTFLNIPLHTMHALALICFIILFGSPLQLFFLDFQLTFLLTFALLWIAHTHHQRKLLYIQSIA